jgi:hypothetical protein
MPGVVFVFLGLIKKKVHGAGLQGTFTQDLTRLKDKFWCFL